MKFGQLTKYIMINILLEKSYTKYGGKTSSRPFSRKSELSICHIKLLPQIKLFEKNKKESGTSFPALFSAWFLKKNLSRVLFY